jgi:hypothetical protein
MGDMGEGEEGEGVNLVGSTSLWELRVEDPIQM